MNYNDLKLDYEGMFSLSEKKDADYLSQILFKKYGNIKILDATAGSGGNSISFGTFFSNVISIEKNTDRYEMLVENLKKYNVKNKIINGNFLEYLNDDYQLIFLDLPWGGPNYKYMDSISLYVDDIMLKKLVEELNNINKIIVLKLPFNYDMNEFINFNYMKYKINKYQIIIIDN